MKPNRSTLLLLLKFEDSSWITFVWKLPDDNYYKVISSLNLCSVFRESPCSKKHILIQAQTVSCSTLFWCQKSRKLVWYFGCDWQNGFHCMHGSSRALHFSYVALHNQKNFNCTVPTLLAVQSLDLRRNGIIITVQNQTENSKRKPSG